MLMIHCYKDKVELEKLIGVGSFFFLVHDRLILPKKKKKTWASKVGSV